MADEKISDLPAASSVADADIAPIVQGGTNKKSAFSVIKAYVQAAFDAIYVPLSRTLNIGGSSQSLAANRTWTTNTILEGIGSPVQGNILYRGASNWVLLAPGTDGNQLTTHGASANPTWDNPASGFAPSNAHYLTSQAESGLTNEVNLGALGTGLLKGTVSGSISTISSITDSSTNWDTAYTERHQWDGGATNLVAATGRTSLGATTVGTAIFTVTNPSAIRFLKVNADNSVTLEDASTFRTDIGAGTGGGDASTNTATSVDSEITLFSSTTGKLLKRATGTGIATVTSGVLGTITQPSGTVVGTTDTQTFTNKRNTARVTTITSSATPTINTDNCDCVTITALAAAISTMSTNLSGTPNNFDKLIFRIKDDGNARALAWGASFVAKGVALPTTTVVSKLLTVGFIYDTVATTWGCVASAQEA